MIRPSVDRALAQLDRHRSATALDLTALVGGATVAEALRGAEAGMQRLAEIAPGWRVGS